MFGDTLKAKIRLPTPLFVSQETKDKEGLISFFILMVVIVCVFIILAVWRVFYINILKSKYSNVVSILTEQGYRFYGVYKSKGNGLLYSKSICKEIIQSLLLRYKFPPLELDCEYRVIDYVAILKFPEWEERLPGLVWVHGGVRLVHFYAIEMKKNGKFFCRPFNHYLDDDLCGEPLDPLDLKNKELVESIFSSNIRFTISEFYDDELRYWAWRKRSMSIHSERSNPPTCE